MSTAKKSRKARKATVTRVADAMLERVIDAFAVSAGTEVARIEVIADMLKAGMTVDNMAAAVLQANRGRPVRGFSRSVAGRYAMVARPIFGKDAATLPTMTDTERTELLAGLATLTNYGRKSADIQGIVDAAAKAGTGRDAVAVIRAEIKDAAHAETARRTDRAIAKRPGAATPGGRALNTPAPVPAATPAPAPSGTRKGNTASETGGIDPAAHTLRSLAEALTARVRTATGLDVPTLDALTDLAEAVEAAVAAAVEAGAYEAHADA